MTFHVLYMCARVSAASSIMDLGSDGFVGTFPSSLLLEEHDFLTGAHKQSEELVRTFVWQAYVCVCLLNRISQPVCSVLCGIELVYKFTLIRTCQRISTHHTASSLKCK